jgi:hypothetical protein
MELMQAQKRIMVFEKIPNKFTFFFFVVLGLELRVKSLLGRHSNTQISCLAVGTHVPGDNFPNSNF